MGIYNRGRVVFLWLLLLLRLGLGLSLCVWGEVVGALRVHGAHQVGDVRRQLRRCEWRHTHERLIVLCVGGKKIIVWRKQTQMLFRRTQIATEMAGEAITVCVIIIEWIVAKKRKEEVN